jgi:hypothetical protein
MKCGHNHLSFPHPDSIKYKWNWWNQCHTITMRYTTLNPYQYVLTSNQPVPLTCKQLVLVLNLYQHQWTSWETGLAQLYLPLQ